MQSEVLSRAVFVASAAGQALSLVSLVFGSGTADRMGYELKSHDKPEKCAEDPSSLVDSKLDCCSFGVKVVRILPATPEGIAGVGGVLGLAAVLQANAVSQSDYGMDSGHFIGGM